MMIINQSVSVSIASILPNKICVKCTPLFADDNNKKPILKNIIYIADKLESSGMLDLLESVKLSKTTKMPAIMPPIVRLRVDSPDTMKATAMPGKMPWDRASPIRLIRLNTIKVPSIDVESVKHMHAARAERIKSYSAKGKYNVSYSMLKGITSSIFF